MKENSIKNERSSIEEDIKILDDYIELIKKGYCEDCNELCNIYGTPAYPAKKISEATEHLIKAYKKIKEIEESHRKENGELREKVKQLEEENKTLNERNQYLVKYRAKLEKELYESNENYIPVSLVEEKIEEINKAYEDSKDENGESEYYYPDYTIRVLEELLEKR